MKKAIVIVCMVVLLLAAWAHVSLFPDAQKIAEWVLLSMGLIIAVLLIISMMGNQQRAIPGLILFFSIALLNSVFLFVISPITGNFLLGGLASILGLLLVLQDVPSSHTRSSARRKQEKIVHTETYDTNPNLELPQMLDSVPQNEPQVEVELETYKEEPVVALGNEKVKRAKRVNASVVSSQKIAKKKSRRSKKR